MKWNKKTFVADMREKCSREVAKIGNDICEFSENHAADISWGRGNDHGTLTYRCDSDFGLLPLFHMTSDCLLYTSPSPRDRSLSRMPSSA